MELHPATDFVFAELLPLIFETSTNLDLLRYRLVNGQWKRVATQLLLKRNSLKITFELKQNPINPDDFTFYAKKHDGYKLCAEHLLMLGTLSDDLQPQKTLPGFFRLVTALPPQISLSLPVDHFAFLLKDPKFKRCQPQLLSFFQTYGHKIKTLTLGNCVDYFVGYPGMPNFILQYTPNLESLHIVEERQPNPEISPEFTQITKGKGFRRFELGHLKQIQIFQPVSRPSQSKPTSIILQHLLQISPKLQQVVFDDLNDPKIVEIFESSKISLLNIRSLFLGEKIMKPEFMSGLENSVQTMMKKSSGVKLRHLTLLSYWWHQTMDKWTRGSVVIRQIVEENINSLNCIELTDGAAFVLHKIRGLSPLPGVKTLKISIDFGNKLSQRVTFDPDFPGNSLDYLFPHVETVAFWGWSISDEDCDRNHFPFWDDRLIGVKTLKTQVREIDEPQQQPQIVNPVRSALPKNVNGKGGIFNCLKLCPEIQKYETHWPYCLFSEILTPLCHLHQLQNLTLIFEVNKQTSLTSFLALDAALTGLSMETVTAIYNNWEQNGEWEGAKRRRVDTEQGDLPENWQVTRVNSSLVDIQYLQQLTLQFDLSSDQTPRMLISGVSAKFAFEVMKNLKVVLNFRPADFGDCCYCTFHDKKAQWLKLHEPLSAFSNVTVHRNK